MQNKNENWLIAGIITVMAIILFINLGSGEIQPWDEGLYAIRSKSILHYNDFWDQTAYSSGGLYSSTYPPLTIWFISGAMSIFGENPFSVRLFSALCSIASLIFIFLISKRAVSFRFSVLTVILTAGTFVWDKFSREGMTDIPLTFFFILTFWSVLKLKESEERKKIILFASLFAIGFACALMTKIVISFIPLLFVIPLLFEKGNKKWFLVIASVIAIALASPWYIYMINHHGAVFYKALLVPHIYSIVETNSPNLGQLYYLNQLLVSNPFIIFAIILLLLLISKKLRTNIIDPGNSNFVVYSTALWFLLTFIILSMAKTKMLHYTIYMIPPAILLIVIFLNNIKMLINKPKLIWFIFIAIITLIIWSLSPGLREDIKQILTFHQFSIHSIIFVSIIICFIVLIISLSGNIILKLSDNFSDSFIFVCSLLLITNIIILNSYYKLGHSYGAEKAAGIVLKSNEKSFIYLYHEATSSESLNPQLAWYTNGIMNKWVNGKSCTTYPLPLTTNLADTLNKMRKIDDNIVIYYKPREEEFAQAVIKDVSKEWTKITYCERYIVFRRK